MVLGFELTTFRHTSPPITPIPGLPPNLNIFSRRSSLIISTDFKFNFPADDDADAVAISDVKTFQRLFYILFCKTNRSRSLSCFCFWSHFWRDLHFFVDENSKNLKMFSLHQTLDFKWKRSFKNGLEPHFKILKVPKFLISGQVSVHSSFFYNKVYPWSTLVEVNEQQSLPTTNKILANYV